LQAEHDDLKAEIETREKTFSTVVALGEAMVKENHSAAKEVRSGHAQLFIARHVHTEV
jgi:spectrin beta